MKINRSAKAFFFQYLKSSLGHIFFYLLTIAFVLVISALFFFKGGFFSGNGSVELVNFWANVPYAAILFVPALSSKKSLNLYDSFVPLKTSVQTVLEILCNGLLFFVSVAFLLFVPLFVSFFGDVDPSAVFVPFVFLLFYGILCVSLCKFIYCFTKNTAAGFALSAVILAAFNSAHLFTVYFSTDSIFTLIFKNLSFAWHFDAASKGIFDTRDFAFLLFFTSLFITASVLVTEKQKGRKLSAFKSILLPGLAVLLLFMNSFRYYRRIDFSKTRSYSVTESTKNLLDSVTSPLKISYYLSPALKNYYPQVRDVKDYLDEYCLENDRISLQVINPDKDDKAAASLNAYGIYPQSFRNVNKSSTEYISVYSAIILEYEGKVMAIPFILSSETLEYLLDSNILILVKGSVPQVHFVCAENESLDSDYSYLRPWLENQNIQTDEIVLDSSFDSVLSGLTGPVFVLGGQNLTSSNVDSLSRYIADGKGLVTFAYSPVSSSISGDWSLSYNNNYSLETLFADYGIHFTSAVAKDISCVRILMYSDDQGEMQQSINYPLWVTLPPQKNAVHGLNFFWTVPLELSEKAEPFLVTTQAAWSEPLNFEAELLMDTNPFTATDMGSGKEKMNLVVGAKSKDQKITVISNRYFLNSLMNGYAGGEEGDYRNFEWLTYHVLNQNGLSELAELQQKTTVNRTLYKLNGEDFNRMKNITLIFIFAVIPLLLAALYVLFKLYSRFARSQALKRL